MPVIPGAILERLRCPDCQERMTQDDAGEVACRAGHRLPWRDGYLAVADRGVDAETERTFASFGYEWTTFDAVRPEDEAYWQNYFADVPLEELRGGVGLDAGCGKGRFTRFTAAYLDALVALDGSPAVEAAVRTLAALPNVAVVRADLRHAPFAPDSFNFISCLGVLHHLPDPRQGFEVLARHLAPGGLMLLYLYSRPEAQGLRSIGLSAATALRKATVHVPHRPLRWASAPIAAALYASLVVPGRLGMRLGMRRLGSLPLATYRGKPVRSLWLDTFERLSAPIEHRYTLDELQVWFAAAGVSVEAAREDAGWFVVLRK
ncbi:MAG: hypothetical protein NVSMB32_03540 [Actinomycetota bacterium]